ncbi:MAG TPA: MBL fold metallo-hydrolase [Bryobacteraceae bacterium]|nr:MBL fold metallo-hydrolase [Bryobacteraceae bacterium]
MTKIAVRTTFILAAALAALAVTASAQQDFSNVQIKTNKISNNFYTLDGAGGTIGVLVGPDGIFMVDTQFAPLTDKIVAAIKQISNAPIKFIVNTHVHGDHTGGDENFGKLGATIIARGSLRNRLMHPAPAANGTVPPATLPVGLPTITYNATSQLAFHMNGEDVQLIPIPNAHTDGDTMVRFVQNDVIMTGDFFRSVQYPNIDRGNGGGLNGMINGLGQIIARSGPNTKIIPGHGPTVDRNAVITHRDMMLAVRDRISKMIKDGKTEAEVVAAKPWADFDSKVPQSDAKVGNTNQLVAQRFATQVYAELKPTR